MPRLAAELAFPDVARTRRQFDRAAPSFASASFIHDEARRRLLERLEAFRIEPRLCVDVGAAHGEGGAALKRRFPDARVVALDSSLQMLRRGRRDADLCVQGDANRLPFADGSVDVLFANLVLPWMQPEGFFAEARRTLSADGVVLFSTLGPDTLGEIRRAWFSADDAIHVHAFWDVQTLGDLAVRAGLEEPVLDVDRIRVTYTGLSGLIRDLRACGATNLAAGRRPGLTGRGRWQRFVEALWHDQGEGEHERLGVTVELIFGQAFGSRAATAGGRAMGPDAGNEISVPIERLGRRRGKPSE
jgi:malonyl-CoA O-methyltransferase